MDEYSSRTRSDSVGGAMRNLMTDMKMLASDTRELLRQATGPSGEQFARLRDRTRDTLTAVEQRLGPLQQKLAEQGRYAAEVSAAHMRTHRWSTLAALAAVGFAVAAIVAWRNETPRIDDSEHEQ